MKNTLILFIFLYCSQAIAQKESIRSCIFTNLEVWKSVEVNKAVSAIQENNLSKLDQYLSEAASIDMVGLKKETHYVSTKLTPYLTKFSFSIEEARKAGAKLYLEKIYYTKDSKKDKITYLYSIRLVCDNNNQVVTINFQKSSSIIHRDKEILIREHIEDNNLLPPPPIN